MWPDHGRMSRPGWIPLAARQHHVIARRQLLQLGYDRDFIRVQVGAGRWKARSSNVISTVTGELTMPQRCWLGVLHAGGEALVGGLSAGSIHELAHWARDDISVLVPDNVVLDPVAGIQWVRTRRRLALLRDPQQRLPSARLEPAILIFAASDRSTRTAIGVLAAAIQQNLTTPAKLLHWINLLAPLRRAKKFRPALAEMAGGAQSLGEIDVGRMCRTYSLAPPTRQVKRKDSSGRWRFTDCEWVLIDGRTVVLEVDGGFHMEVGHWQADMARDRALAAPKRTTVRCTTIELRDGPATVAADLRRLGVPAQSPPPAGRVTERGK